MPIAFSPVGTFSGVQGGPNVVSNPTSLQFGPDGRLYVAEQNGDVNAFTVSLSNGQYVATSHELLTLPGGGGIVKSIQNHNDDGTPVSGGQAGGNTNNRQVTGLVVTGTAENPVLYISSSDPRIATNNDVNLDTNSGVISRATWTGSEWDVVDIVRGLPRSEENHSNNGLAFNPNDPTKLYVMVGGNTNNGAPSGFFAYTGEYALSGTLLEIDLDDIESRPILTDPGANQDGTARQYVYDLPTLDDPNTPNITDGVGEDENGLDEDGPWGGNDGLNMAVLPADAPLRVYADGFRNAYDIAFTADGRLYTVDNGGNGNLGGDPTTETGDDDGDGIPGEFTNDPNDGGDGDPEPLFLIEEGGYYGHPAPIRSNQNQSWTSFNNSGDPDTGLAQNTVADISAQVPDGVQIPDGFVIDPSKFAAAPGQSLADLDATAQQDRLTLSGTRIQRNGPGDAGAIVTVGSSTNGVMVYDSQEQAFDGVLDGKLFVTQFNDNVTLLNLNEAGDGLAPVPTEGPDGEFGTADDGVQDQDGVYFVANNSLGVPLGNPLDVTMGPNGTLWVAEIGSNEITVLAPADVILPGDNDSDDDGILNTVDPFLRDASNGTGVTVAPGAPTVWEFSQGADDTTPGPDGFGGGLTGHMIDGTTDFEAFLQSPRPGAQIQLDNVKFVTAAGGGTTVVEEVSEGDPFEDSNTGQFLFHTGFVLAPNVETFTVAWAVKNPGAVAGSSDITNDFQQIGGYLGDGTQSNYLKIVAIATNNDASQANIQIALENDDTVPQTINLPANGIFDGANLVPNSDIVFELTVNLTDNTVTPKATFNTTAGDVEVTGAQTIDLTDSNVLSAILGNNTVQGQQTGLAAGLFSSNFGSPNDTFQAVFDSITVSATEAQVPPDAVDDEAQAGVGVALEIPVGTLLANDTDANPGDTLTVTGVSNAVNGAVSLDNGLVTFTPADGFEGDASFDYTISDGTDSDTATVSVMVANEVILYRVNAGGNVGGTGAGTIAAIDGGPDWVDDSTLIDSTGPVSLTGATGDTFSNGLTNAENEVDFLDGANAADPAIAPWQVFVNERSDNSTANPKLTYNFDVTPGANYKVSLFYTENWNNIFGFASGTSGGKPAGQSRQFDVEVEGAVPAEFDGINPLAESAALVGGTPPTGNGAPNGEKQPFLGVALQRDFVVTAGDDTLTLAFNHEFENPKINAIQIAQVGSEVTPPDPDPVLNILTTTETVTEGETAFISIATDITVPNDENVTFTYVIEGVTATPEIDYEPDASLNGAGTATFTGTGTITGGSADFQIPVNTLPDELVEGAETFTVTITSVSPNATLGPDSVATVTIEDDDVAAGSVVVAINAGGPALTQDGINFAADQFFDNGSTFTDGVNFDVNNGNGAQPAFDGTVYETERFGGSDNGTMSYSIPVPNGDYTVELYFAEIFQPSGGGNGIGARVFDVTVEGQPVLDDFDILEQTGGDINQPVVFTVPGVVSPDGGGDDPTTIDINFSASADNAKISAIVIRDSEGNVYEPPVDDLFGTAVEIADTGDAPSGPVTLAEGSNVMSATQEGEASGLNGVRDRDYFTVDVPEGFQLTGVILDAYDNAVNPTAPDAFLAFQQGGAVTVDPVTGADVGDLQGAIIYGAGEVGQDLLDTMRGGFNDPATGNSLPGFTQPLTGTWTFWLNQGAGPSTATLDFIVEPLPPTAITLSIGDAPTLVENGDTDPTTLEFPITASDIAFSGVATIAYDQGAETGLTQSVTFAGGAGTLSVDVASDDVDDGPETVTVTLTGADDGATVFEIDSASESASGIVTEDDGTTPNDIDGDGIPNTNDPFAYDAQNGLGRVLTPGAEFRQDFDTDTTDPFSTEGGFIGILVNPAFDYGNPADPAADPYGNRTNEGDVDIAGGTLTILSTETDAFPIGGAGTNNTLADGYQSAVDVSGIDQFEVHARASSADWLASTSANGFSQFGIALGAGGVDDFVKLVLSDNGGTGGSTNPSRRVQVAHNNSLVGGEQNFVVGTGDGPGVDLALVGDVEFRLIVDRTAGDNGQITGQVDFFAAADGALLESFVTPAVGILADSSLNAAMDGQNPLTDGTGGLAYGVFVSDWSAGAGNRITANYDFLAIRSLDAVQDLAPTAVTLENVAALPEDTDTTAAVKVADIAVADDGVSNVELTLVGADAALFEVVGTELLLTAGTALDFETQNSFDVSVVATDAVGSATSAPLGALVTDVNEAPVLSGTVADQTVTAGETVDVSAVTATDPDAGDTATLTLRAQGGGSAPAGIALTGGAITVATDVAAGDYALEIVALDDAQVESATTASFTLTVEAGAPTTFTTKLQAGELTILDTDGFDGNGVGIDSQVRNLQNPEDNPSGNGKQDGIWIGSEGDEYLDLGVDAGDGAQFIYNASEAGTGTLTFRYAVGSQPQRPMTIFVNGVEQGIVTFTNTGEWFNWEETSIEIDLAPGQNTISFTQNQNSFGPNIDFVSLETTVAPADDAAPVFDAAPAAASVPENATGAVADFDATDSDGTPVLFSLAGDDGGDFVIDENTGELSFATAPDFEAPTDADGDNIYDVDVVASSGGLSTSASIAVTVEDLPSIAGGSVADGATGVDLNAGFNFTFDLVGGVGIDNTTIDATTVKIIEVGTGNEVPSTSNGSGGNDALSVTPLQTLDPDTDYEIVIDGVLDLDGRPLEPFQVDFTTGEDDGGPVDPLDPTFTVSDQATGVAVTSLEISPDGTQLYAASFGGTIYRWDIDPATGALSNQAEYTGLAGSALIGIAFDPNSPNDLWLTKNLPVGDQPDFTGEIVRLTLDDGPGFTGTATTMVTGLPRSVSDHLTNSIEFNAAGEMFVVQGGNTASGAADGVWGNRDERLLSAAVLKVDHEAIAGLVDGGGDPLDVQTDVQDADPGQNGEQSTPPGGRNADGSVPGFYNPFEAGALVTIHATGIRNAYDLAWHSNGFLYVPTNGTGTVGNVPDDPSTAFDESTINSGAPKPDLLFKSGESGGEYFGHPNATRGEYIAFGGNPTDGPDVQQINGYPVGTQPDPNFEPAAFIFNNGASANGTVEFTSSVFNGALQGALLVARFSSGDDIRAFELDANGEVVGNTALKNTAGDDIKFANPLDVVTDASGRVYVIEFQRGNPGSSSIVLLSPDAPPVSNPSLAVSGLTDVATDDRIVFSSVASVVAGTQTADIANSRTIEIENTGTGDLLVSSLDVTGAFALGDPGQAGGFTVPAGGSVSVAVNFVPTANGVAEGSLVVNSNDASEPARSIVLAGYNQPILENNQEPSVGQIMQVFGFTTDLGGLANRDGDDGAAGDEVISAYWEAADPGQPVTVTQIAAFTGPRNYQVQWFAQDSGATSAADLTINPIFTHAPSDSHTLLPDTTQNDGPAGDPATGSFTPTGPFGLAIEWLGGPGSPSDFTDPLFQTQDDGAPGNEALPGGDILMRMFPLIGADGQPVPDTYLLFQDYQAVNFDWNDNVYIVRNVQPSGTAPDAAPTAQLVLTPPADADADLVVTATFADDNAIDDATVEEGDLALSGPSAPGATAYAYDAANDVATWTFSAPAGGWADGDYTATFAAGSVLDDAAQGIAETTESLSLDFTPTQAGELIGAINVGGTQAYTRAADGTVFIADPGPTSESGPSEINTRPNMDFDGTDDDDLFRDYRFSENNEVASFEYDIDVPEAGLYAVTLYIAEIFFAGPGSREFDIFAEDTQVADDLDPAAAFGPVVGGINGSSTGGTISFEIEVTDGVLDLTFADGPVNNALLNGIEVRAANVVPPAPSALIEVLAGGGNINASTFGNTSFQITNTGDAPITQVVLDLASGVLPDIVFDPDGTAGDTTAKGFTQDGSSDATGVTPSFGVPNEGGFYTLTLDFTDFQPGETLVFGLDTDPTSVKGQSAPGAGESGSVSGLEMVGSGVSVTFDGGTTLTSSLFEDGSNAGAVAVVAPDAPGAPTIELVGGLSPSTVTTAAQTIFVTGMPGATVRLLQAEGAMFEPAGGAFDVEPFEANSFVSREPAFTGTLDANGELSIPVTLLNSVAEGGFNHFIAVVEGDDGQTSATSNTLVVEFDQDFVEPGNAAALVEVTPDAGLGASTDEPGAFQITNNGSAQITSVTIDLSTAVLPDMVFDPTGAGGDGAGLGLTADSGAVETGFLAPANPTGEVGGGSTGTAFLEQNGLVVVEMESGTFSGNWQDSDSYSTDFSPNVNNPGGATGGDFIIWQGGQSLGTPGNGLIEYEIEITNPGLYQFQWRNQVGNGTNTTEHNDTWLKIEADQFYGIQGNPATSTSFVKPADAAPGTFPAGAEDPEGSSADGWFKVYSSGANNWSWSTNTSDNDAHQIYAQFDNPGTYKILVSARSSSHAIDRMVLHQVSPNDFAGNPLALGNPESPLATTQGDGPFSQPREGGYDVVTLNFDDFDQGETFTFSADVDPNSLQGQSGAGSVAEVSGFELTGATVTITYDDGSSDTTRLYEDGSLGGAQAVSDTATDLVAPTIELVGFGDVVPSAIDGGGRQQATVAALAQTIKVTGTPGADFSLLMLDAALEGGAPFNVDAAELAFYANAATAGKTLFNGVLDGNGEAEVAVTLPGTPDVLNHFVAVTSAGAYAPGVETSATSNAIVVNYDPAIQPTGSAVLTINENANGIETSNFGNGSFSVTNTGDKAITFIEIDVTDALLVDAVFDPFGIAGDTTGKVLTPGAGSAATGLVTPTGGFGQSAVGVTYLGDGGIAGFERIRLAFADFDPGETLTFGIDMDPNSIAGAEKGPLDSGAPLVGAGGGNPPVWDVGGVGGAELAGSSFIVGYADGGTSIGQLHGQGTGQQMGAKALSTEDTANALGVTLTVNGLTPGAEGTYTTGGPQILVQGPAGETARVLVTKGFIVPFTNEFPDTDPYAAQLDAQLQALEASGFPANNAVEMLYVDVALDGTVQDISGLFDFTQVAAFDLSVPDAINEFGVLEEDKLPLGIVASVIDPADDLPKGPVTSPIHLTFSDAIPPVANPDTAAAVPDAPTTIAAADLLLNDTDDGPLTITGAGTEGLDGATNQGGTVTVGLDGDVLYTPPAGFTGTDSFSYTVTDQDQNTAVATVTVTVAEPAPLEVGATVTVSGTSTFGTSAFDIANSSAAGIEITEIAFDIGTAFMSLGLDLSGTGEFLGAVWDPTAEAGDAGGQAIKFNNNAAGLLDGAGDPLPNSVTAGNGFSGDAGAGDTYPFREQLPGGDGGEPGGFRFMDLAFGDFTSGESFVFGVDVDPQSIQNASGTGQAGSVSGAEIAGTTVTITFEETATGRTVTETRKLVSTGPNASQAVFDEAPIGAAPVLDIDGLTNAATRRVIDPDLTQTVTVSGLEPGQWARLYVFDASGYEKHGGNGSEAVPQDEFHASQLDAAPTVIEVQADGAGLATFVELALTDVPGANPATVDGLFFFAAVGLDGQGGAVATDVSTPAQLKIGTPVVTGDPTPADDLTSTPQEQTVFVNFVDLLANDTDPDGDPADLKIVGFGTPGANGFLSDNGALVTLFDATGAPTTDVSLAVQALYGPPPPQGAVPFTGEDTISYTVEDLDGNQATATLTIAVTASIVGDEFDNELTGTDFSERFFGVQGDDEITANGGDDIVFGFTGNDDITGGAGNDRLDGEIGDDTIDGGDGLDFLYGGDGNDTITGGADTDALFGDAGNDTLSGGLDGDNLDGGEGDDDLFGEEGVDWLFGQAGNDLLDGGAETDALFGGDGDDQLFGGEGGDNLDGGDGNDLLEGGAGVDYLYGQTGNDRLFGGADLDALFGGAGVDTFVLAPGADEEQVFDFEIGVDLIDVSAMGVTQLGGMFIEQVGAHWQISVPGFGDDTMLLIDAVASGSLIADDFIFSA